MKKNSIIYLGDIKEVTLDIDRLQSILNCNFKVLDYGKNYSELFSKIISFLPKIILIEIKNVDSDILSFFILLKSHSKLMKSRIIAIFPDKNNLNHYSDIYSFGVEYGFIKGEEFNKICGDIGVFLDRLKFKPTQYAQANDLYIPAASLFLAKISHLNQNEINIETSLLLKKNELIEANLNFDKPINLKFFKVLDNNFFSPRSYFSNSAKIKILYEGDEDLKSDIVGSLSTEEEFSFYLCNIKPEPFYRNDPALIIDKRTDTLAELISELNVNNRFIKICDSYSIFNDSLSLFSPKLICYQMDKETDDMEEDDCLRVNGLTTFNMLIQKIKSIPDYNPYVLVFNERSRSQAYRKAHTYENIIVNKASFQLKYLSMLMDEFQNNHPIIGDELYLRPPDSNTIIEIHKEVILTSISENQISFLYEGDLSDYCTFKISSPLNIFITVIPSVDNFKSSQKLKSYLGIITNTSEKEKMELRKLVNLLIKVELQDGEVLRLKSVKELRKDIIQSKSLELKKRRIIEKADHMLKKLEDEDEDE